jgi:hypothetical protein
MLGPMTSTIEADLDYSCPRCRRATIGRFYGPCDTCRDELRIAYLSEARNVEAEEYVPKMNVTPNAIATKD